MRNLQLLRDIILLMKVYLVRHGETTGNVEGLHQVPETPLTKTGRQQAGSVAERLKNKDIDLIYSSPHERAKNTAKIISKSIERPVELWDDLTEIRRPKEIRGKSADNPAVKKIEDLVFENFGNSDWKYSDEENFYDLLSRSKNVLAHLLKNHKNQTIVCISHGTFIKMLAALAVFGDKLTPELFMAFRRHFIAENTGISVLKHTNDHGWGLQSWNDVSHL